MDHFTCCCLPGKIAFPIGDAAVYSMCHFIDMSDHFAHFDSKITEYNFLKFNKNTWSIIDNSIQPQNRMRFVDYKAMYAKLKIPITEEAIREGDVTKLRRVKMSKQFAAYPPEQLAITHGYLFSKMKA